MLLHIYSEIQSSQEVFIDHKPKGQVTDKF